MANQPQRGLRRIINAFGYSIQGFRDCYRHEEAFRQESLLALALIPLGLWLGTSPVERALLVSSVMLVLLAELLNSAVEAAIDRIGPDHHELSGRAKDIGSAAVFTSLALMATIWGLLLTPRLFS